MAVSMLASAGATLLFAGSAQAAAWLAPQNVFATPVTSIPTDPYFNRLALDVASDGSGNTVAAWIEEHSKSGGGTECQAMVASRKAGGSFGAPMSLAPPMPYCTGQLKLAINTAGTAVVAWRQGPDIDAAIGSATGSFGPATTLSASSATDDPWVSINASGVAAVSWDDTNTASCPGILGNWAFHVSIRPAGGNFGPFDTACDAPQPTGPTIFTPRIAVDPQGDVAATWVNRFSDGTHTHIDVEAAFRPSGGSFSSVTPQVLSDMVNPSVPAAGAGGFAADVGVDASGHATAVWPVWNGTNHVIETASRPAGTSSTFGASGPISDTSTDSGLPRLVIDPASNTAVAVWVQCPHAATTPCQVEGASRLSGGGFGTPQALSGPGAQGDYGPVLALAPSGAATAIWSGPSPDISGTQVQAATRPPGLNQSFGAVTTISNATPSSSPAIAFDGQGNAIAVWEHDTTAPAGAVLQYAGFDAAPPTISLSSTPNAVVGQPATFSASVADVWSSATATWNFGDGATATGTQATHTYSQPGNYTVTLTAVDGAGNQSSATETVAVSSATETVGCGTAPPGVELTADCHAVRLISFKLSFRVAKAGHGRLRFRSIFVTKLTPGAHVQLRCLGKRRGCPFARRAVRRTGRRANLAKLLGFHALKPGATVQIWATEKGAIGAVEQLKLNKRSARVSKLCVPVGGKAAQAACSA